jgi:hypothetical protein
MKEFYKLTLQNRGFGYYKGIAVLENGVAGSKLTGA